MKPHLVATLALAGVALGAVARADDDTSQRAAEVLFSEARDLMRDSHFEEACPKLAQSQELAPALGTLLNLGVCLEKVGRTASAWSRFRSAASEAASKHDDAREQFARAHIKDLEPVLARLSVEVAPEAASNHPRVELDGTALAAASWGVAIPVDPGEHVVVASADGRRTFSKRVAVAASTREVVRVDLLPAESSRASGAANAERGATSPPADAAPRSQGRSAQATAGLIVGGVGAVATATGLVLGVVAKVRYDSTSASCPSDRCTPQARDTRNGAYDVAFASSVLVGAGLATLAGGGVLLWTAPRSTAGVAVIPAPRGATLRVTF
jgi:hypothetical protein